MTRDPYPLEVHISTGVKLPAFDSLLLFLPLPFATISQFGHRRLCVSCNGCASNIIVTDKIHGFGSPLPPVSSWEWGGGWKKLARYRRIARTRDTGRTEQSCFLSFVRRIRLRFTGRAPVSLCTYRNRPHRFVLHEICELITRRGRLIALIPSSR